MRIGGQSGAVKVYGIFPAFDLHGANAREDEARCIAIVAGMVFDCLRADGDDFHYLVDWRDPGAPPDMPGFNSDIAEPHIVELRRPDALRDCLTKAVDPDGTGGGTVRSIATCRAATFGFDGQAYVCLRHEDAPPVSPDPSLVIVEERPDILLKTDLFDGWLRETSRIQPDVL